MNKVLKTVYFTTEQADALDKLSEETRVARAVLIREAIDMLLIKYNGKKKKENK